MNLWDKLFSIASSCPNGMLNLTGLTQKGKGTYSRYFILPDGRGVKMLRTLPIWWNTIDGGLKLGDDRLLKQMKEATKEYAIYKQAEKSGVTPKVYSAELVCFENHYYAAIIMEHIEGEVFENRRFKRRYTMSVHAKIEYILKKKLRSVGVEHNDLHIANVITRIEGKRKRSFAIDFTPQYVNLKEEAV